MPAFLVDMLRQHKMEITNLEGTMVAAGQLDTPITRWQTFCRYFIKMVI